jgi:phosphoribosylamine--glycine ligase
MRVMVIGSGGREHAICHAVARSERLRKLFVLPGNAGTASLGENIAGDPNDIDFVVRAARDKRVDLTIVGPEDPLAAGVVDALEEAGLRVFGPNAAAARIEADKAFAKQLMKKAGVPTAEARIFAPTEQERLREGQPDGDEASRAAFSGYDRAREYVGTREGPLVIKAAGLAKGKGVVVCDEPAEALVALERMMVRREFGEAGRTVVVEERLQGREVSVFALVDGRNIYILDPAQDYKRAYDNDEGPNTGGMGAFCPGDAIDAQTMATIERQVLIPTIDVMLREGIPYRGLLYAGLMLTTNGPKVLEFNCRFGDPETQPMLLRIRSDPLDLFDATVDGRLDEISIDWDPRTAVCVVMASGGYPGTFEKGMVIDGLPDVGGSRDFAVYHAGTELREGKVVTAGGRVLGVTALGDSVEAARQRAYDIVSGIRFKNAIYRTDIAARR